MKRRDGAERALCPNFSHIIMFMHESLPPETSATTFMAAELCHSGGRGQRQERRRTGPRGCLFTPVRGAAEVVEPWAQCGVSVGPLSAGSALLAALGVGGARLSLFSRPRAARRVSCRDGLSGPERERSRAPSGAR